ncbi:sacsin N-terminal ATP-binding-like domain-containing protein [Paenibacillus chitinolyticus]|uniref:sacsin N-terminal ATP-binding-like domain-containing protein n=1 Tax=Paenibacillus chitinolyticus TaxID=79263 RepID=UPI003CFD32A8
MSLKADIEKIFLDNTDYANPGQAVNQASSLNALSSDLYTDSKRFIYELLQNADDSSQEGKAIKVWIKTFGDNLVVAHSGKPFTSRDLQGICNVNNGTKKSDLTKTGYKGIGFKSVFGQSDKVTIFTKDEYFRFDSAYPFDWKWEDSKIIWEKMNDREFQFPWQIIPIYTERKEIPEPIYQFLKDKKASVATIIQMKNASETSQAAQSLSQNLNMFLFLKNISEISFDIIELVSVEINRIGNDKITLNKSSSSKTEWLINTVNLTVPRDVKAVLQDERNIPEKLLNADSIELSLAAKLGGNGVTKLSGEENLLYSYLPTGEKRYHLPVLVNTSFLTTSNRESLHADSKWNQWIFKTIAIEIFKWIANLVGTKVHFQAYQLIPKDIAVDELGKRFNEGIKEALKNIPFVTSREGQLIKIEETIVDFTYLSEKSFIGEEPIKKLIDKNNSKQFAENCGYFSEFKRLGSSYFDWKQLKSFLTSTFFADTHTIPYNIELIKHLKKASESDLDKDKDISKDVLMKLPFIWDHKGHINYPYQVCFPTADDQNWDNSNSDLSFLHRDLQSWLLEDLESRHWLESLGVKEKTDITYITQNILPKIDNYIQPRNAVQTLQDLFSLYRKGILKEDLISQLSRIKLLTQSNDLCPAQDCFLSDYYKPRLEIEKIIERNIFVNELYCENVLEKDEWKRFFKMLGVREGITRLSYTNKLSKSALIDVEFDDKYFETTDKKFAPWVTTFTADEFSHITTMNFIQLTENNFEFAFKFWSDFIGNYSPNIIKEPATAYWGNEHRPGRTSGDPIENYVPWFVNNIKCVPTLSGECETASSVLLNTEEIKAISGKYLKVFNGPELSADWRAFFNFRTNVEISDYLDLLRKISLDFDVNGSIKNENSKRIQFVYSALLAQCANWSTEDISEVEEWANTGLLLNTKGQFTECKTLKYFLDGNEAVFQDQYCFIKLSAENKKNPNLETFLKHFKIQLLRQSKFELIYTQEEKCSALKTQLEIIIPYFKLWIENEEGDDKTKNSLDKLQGNVEALNYFQAEDLKISYKGIDFIKSVNIHFNERSLYVTKPWNSNSVLLRLSEVLCNYFDLVGHDKKLDFLLRSTVKEIQNYFMQEELDIPEELLEISLDYDDETNNQDMEELNDILKKYGVSGIQELENILSRSNIESSSGETVEISMELLAQWGISTEEELNRALAKNVFGAEFIHDSKRSLKLFSYVQEILERSKKKIIEFLDKQPEYDVSDIIEISNTIFIIKKHNSEIYIIARPSDYGQIILYYDSELDVLDYEKDCELWVEDKKSDPQKITFGKILKLTGVNKIPLRSIREK